MPVFLSVLTIFGLFSVGVFAKSTEYNLLNMKLDSTHLCVLFKTLFTDSKLGAAEVWTSRQALQDLYQKMLVTDLEYALDKKVEQDL